MPFTYATLSHASIREGRYGRGTSCGMEVDTVCR